MASLKWNKINKWTRKEDEKKHKQQWQQSILSLFFLKLASKMQQYELSYK